ncbi:uncharacterized protein LOC127578682 [Pristis pectinata]|uniref:uncharacterized protein LOC127578682 n=1 Tax=Pristis pectinata TaxID=685728 RepID=UPI00223E5126|nr:uncharacterized protein LOC127578682 [Pristis pectinata]
MWDPQTLEAGGYFGRWCAPSAVYAGFLRAPDARAGGSQCIVKCCGSGGTFPDLQWTWRRDSAQRLADRRSLAYGSQSMPGNRSGTAEERQAPVPELQGSDMDLVLSKLKDFSCKPTRFADWDGRDSQPGLYKRQSCPDIGWDPHSKRQRVDLEKALDRLKSELMEMRSQNQSLVKQLMELHEGIQDLKQECDSDREVDGSGNDSNDSEDDSGLNHSHPRLSLQAAISQKRNRRNSLP